MRSFLRSPFSWLIAVGFTAVVAGCVRERTGRIGEVDAAEVPETVVNVEVPEPAQSWWQRASAALFIPAPFSAYAMLIFATPYALDQDVHWLYNVGYWTLCAATAIMLMIMLVACGEDSSFWQNRKAKKGVNEQGSENIYVIDGVEYYFPNPAPTNSVVGNS